MVPRVPSASYPLLLLTVVVLLLLLVVVVVVVVVPTQAEIGIDAGAYARLLMAHAKDAADLVHSEGPVTLLSPQDILEAAYYRTNVQGEAEQRSR
jgi:hypothetical protein